MSDFPSPEYIEEVKHHAWIQEAWEPKVGDWVLLDEKARVLVDAWVTRYGGQAITYSYKEGGKLDAKYGSCMAASSLWLPTLGDLVRMVAEKGYTVRLTGGRRFLQWGAEASKNALSFSDDGPFGDGHEPKIAVVRLLAAVWGKDG